MPSPGLTFEEWLNYFDIKPCFFLANRAKGGGFESHDSYEEHGGTVGLAALRPISLRVSFQNLDRDLGENAWFNPRTCLTFQLEQC
jgi:hypothetical protein